MGKDPNCRGLETGECFRMQNGAGNGNAMTLQKLVDDLKAVVHDSDALFKARAAQLRVRAVTGARAAGEIIRRNPYASLGVVFGLGLIAGMALSGLLSTKRTEHEQEVA